MYVISCPTVITTMNFALNCQFPTKLRHKTGQQLTENFSKLSTFCWSVTTGYRSSSIRRPGSLSGGGTRASMLSSTARTVSSWAMHSHNAYFAQDQLTHTEKMTALNWQNIKTQNWNHAQHYERRSKKS